MSTPWEIPTILMGVCTKNRVIMASLKAQTFRPAFYNEGLAGEIESTVIKYFTSYDHGPLLG